MPRSHRDLVVWRKSVELVVEVYRVRGGFPAGERFGLTAQLRRAAVSVPANIAEGSGRGSINDYRRSLAIARGSAMEVETLLTIAVRLDFLPTDVSASLLSLTLEISRMLAVLRTRLGPPTT
jgi:four helix bundle protein